MGAQNICGPIWNTLGGYPEYTGGIQECIGGGAILSYVGEVSLSIAHGLSPVKLRCKGLYFGSDKDLANPT